MVVATICHHDGNGTGRSGKKRIDTNNNNNYTCDVGGKCFGEKSKFA
jgi:hypothetical protein